MTAVRLPVAPEAHGGARRLAWLGQQAVLALYDELALFPKPGLVSFVDSGSHSDMDARTFMRSLFALRRAFPELARLGASRAPFAELQAAGITAEAHMMQATGGVNTHRGAIFTLGLLCAAAGLCHAHGLPLTAAHLRRSLMGQWGEELTRRAQRRRDTNGSRAARALGLRCVGAEAAEGFPVLFETVWPQLRGALARGLSQQNARLEALFAAMAVLDDTNVAHRGGLAGLLHVQSQAHAFLEAGGDHADVQARALALHHDFVHRRLSPGGAADLLAAACWLQRVTRGL